MRGAVSIGVALAVALSAATGHAAAQDGAPDERPSSAPAESAEPRRGEGHEVPTAADEPVLGASPLREEPVPGGPPERPPTTVLELPVTLELFRLPTPPVHETWWFWISVSALVVGVALSVVVALAADGESVAARAGLALRW